MRVRVIHLGEKKNKAGGAIARVKIIFGLGNKNDGHRLDHAPRVQSFGAGPKDVEFFLNNSSGAPSSSSTGQVAGTPGSKKKRKGKKGAEPSQGAGPNVLQGGRYITVYEFFRSGIYSITAQLYSLVIRWVVHGRSIENPNLPVVNVGNRGNPEIGLKLTRPSRARRRKEIRQRWGIPHEIEHDQSSPVE